MKWQSCRVLSCDVIRSALMRMDALGLQDVNSPEPCSRRPASRSRLPEIWAVGITAGECLVAADLAALVNQRRKAVAEKESATSGELATPCCFLQRLAAKTTNGHCYHVALRTIVCFVGQPAQVHVQTVCCFIAGMGLHNCNELASHCILSSDTSGEFEYIVWLDQHRIYETFWMAVTCAPGISSQTRRPVGTQTVELALVAAIIRTPRTVMLCQLYQGSPPGHRHSSSARRTPAVRLRQLRCCD